MLSKKEFELLMREDYDPGKINIFHIYRHTPRTLRILLEHLTTSIRTLGGVNISREYADLYKVYWEGTESEADDYIRIVEREGTTQIWAARQASLVELTLLRGKVDYDKANVSMPLKQAFSEKAEPIDLDGLVVREVRHYSPSN